jgi:cytochrome c oxidase assembly protein subunit 15
MRSTAQDLNPTPRWLHAWAVFTVCATLVLLLIGSVVTTVRVGMADPSWPTYPWHLLVMSWDELSPGLLIEHSHRLAGYLVGCCVIVLTVGLWLHERRRWVQWLGTAALLGVIVQGLLGGFRVTLHALLGTDLATIHGCFAQVVFALLVSLALCTSRGWIVGWRHGTETNHLSLRRLSLFTTGLLFVQIVLGAILRHTYSPLSQRGHLLVAFLAVAAVAWLVKMVWENHSEERPVVRAALLLALLVFFQVLLGVEAWISRFSSGVLPELQQVTAGQLVIRTMHVMVGFGILATSVVVTLRAHRHLTVSLALKPAPSSRLEGAA